MSRLAISLEFFRKFPFMAPNPPLPTSNFQQQAAMITWQSKPGCRMCSFAALTSSLGIWLLSCLLILMLVELIPDRHFEVTFTQQTFPSETLKPVPNVSLFNAFTFSVYSTYLLIVCRIPGCWESPYFVCISFYNVTYIKYQSLKFQQSICLTL